MAVKGIGGTTRFNGFSEKELTAVRQFFGVNKDDLEDLKKQFDKAKVETPEGISKLVDSFKDYDLNKDDVLSVSEILTFHKEEKSSLNSRAMSLIGAGEGSSAEQLELMAKISRKAEQRNEELEYLHKRFERFDKDSDGRISANEYDNFAKRRDLELADKKDEEALQDSLTARVIGAYERNKENSTGFILSLFVTEA